MKHIKKYPTKERLHELFEYKDGQLFWKVRKALCVKLGDSFGSKKPNGYVDGAIDRGLYRVHRLIWIWHNGDIPKGMLIDHINGIKDDNRIENLRVLSNRDNVRSATCSTGERNIYPTKNGKFKVQFCHGQRARHYGVFNTIDEAINKRDEVKAEMEAKQVRDLTRMDCEEMMVGYGHGHEGRPV